MQGETYRNTRPVTFPVRLEKDDRKGHYGFIADSSKVLRGNAKMYLNLSIGFVESSTDAELLEAFCAADWFLLR